MNRQFLSTVLLIIGGFLLLGPFFKELPKPDPPKPPVPPGERYVLVIHESSDRTAAEAATIASLRRWLESNHDNYNIVDKDLIEPSGASAKWLEPYLVEIRSKDMPLPALVVSVPPTDDHDGAYLLVEPLPGRGQEAIAMVEEALNRE